MRSFRFVAVQVVLLGFLLCLPSMAQVSGGTISGTISDSSGAIVPSARVSVQNKDTGSVKEVVVNNDGLYSVPNLVPGDYLVTASAPGFENAVAKVDLSVGAKQLLNLILNPGKVTENVQVTEQAPTVDLSTSSVGGLVTGREVRELPLNGRSWTDLVTLQPGVNVPTSLAPVTSDERPDRGYGAQVAINGARPQQNNYRLDGISVNDNANGAPGSVLGGTLGVDAIQEFSVLTVNYSAEYGRTSGGVVNAVTRSGTNEFHGAAYDFLRNQVLDARNFFDLQPKKPGFRRNQFGASAGGPIWKDHTFIFGDYEGIRQAKGISSNSTVPSSAARSGNLCSVPDGSCTPTTITVDNAATQYLALYPLPNAGLLPGGDIGQFNFAPNDVTHENFFTIRADHKLTSNDNLFGTLAYDKATDTSPDPLNIVSFGSVTKHAQVILEETHTFSNALVNALRFGFNRAVTLSFGGVSAINPAAKDPSLAAVPGQFAAQVNITGVTHMQGGVAPNKNYIWNSFQVYDDAFLARGRHSMKFGFAAERMQLSLLLTTAPTGSFDFGTLQDFLTNGHDNNPFISFQADFPSSATPRYLRQSLFGGYFQDDWHIRPTLTLNLGVRYEMTTVPTALQNKLATLINPTDPTPHLGNPFYLNPTLHNFEPRVGFAWDPFHNGRTAVRSGFGMFDVLPLPYEFEFLTRASPYFLTGSATGLPPGSFFNGAFPLLGASSTRQTFIQHDPPRNYMMQWNLNVQREITKSLSTLIAYVGSRGVHQPFRADDMNAVLPCNLKAQPGCPPASVLSGQGLFWPSPIASGTIINPNFGQIAGFRWGGDSYYHALEVQLNQRIGHLLQAQGALTWSKSIDTSSSSLIGDAFQTTISSPYWWSTRYGRGLSDFDIGRNLVINLTWEVPGSKSWSGPTGWLANGWQLSGIFKAADGTPFTPTFGTDADPLGLNSGDPFDYPNRLGGPGCNSLTNPGHPNHYIKTECFAIPTANAALYPYCDASVHGLNPPAPQCFNLRGNAGRNILIGPGFTDLDFSIVKNSYIKRISESFNVQFRAEIFNILNHPNFISNKHNDIFDSTGALVPTAGVLGATVLGNERQIQLALKVIWQ
jgi:hypothetical protein